MSLAPAVAAEAETAQIAPKLHISDAIFMTVERSIGVVGCWRAPSVASSAKRSFEKAGKLARMVD